MSFMCLVLSICTMTTQKSHNYTGRKAQPRLTLHILVYLGHQATSPCKEGPGPGEDIRIVGDRRSLAKPCQSFNFNILLKIAPPRTAHSAAFACANLAKELLKHVTTPMSVGMLRTSYCPTSLKPATDRQKRICQSRESLH